jgi:hypothetical protein
MNKISEAFYWALGYFRTIFVCAIFPQRRASKVFGSCSFSNNFSDQGPAIRK